MRKLIDAVTNAAGGLNQQYRVGDIVCLNDVSVLDLLRDVETDDCSTCSWLAWWACTHFGDPTSKSSVSVSLHYQMRTTLIYEGGRTRLGSS